MRELELIKWIGMCAERRRDPLIAAGIGDDCAVVNPMSGQTLVTTDMILAGSHFRSDAAPRAIGHKAMAVNLSDMAAMAGRPVAAFVSVALPAACERENAVISDAFVQEVFEGMFALVDAYEVTIAGGDTNSWQGPLAISVTLIGHTTNGRALMRNGATVGDWVMVTGRLGGSLAGRHLEFLPRVREAQTLHAKYFLHTMIDLSDGLATDLRHICESSRVGIELISQNIPISSQIDAKSEADELRAALCDGEDFELAFTVTAAEGEKILRDQCLYPLTISHIGTVVGEAGLRWCRDSSYASGAEIIWRGFEHQKF